MFILPTHEYIITIQCPTLISYIIVSPVQSSSLLGANRHQSSSWSHCRLRRLRCHIDYWPQGRLQYYSCVAVRRLAVGWMRRDVIADIAHFRDETDEQIAFVDRFVLRRSHNGGLTIAILACCLSRISLLFYLAGFFSELSVAEENIYKCARKTC